MQKKKTSILISAIFLMCVLSVAIGRASVGDITLDDASSFDGNLTVSGLGSFGSVLSGQGLYPLVTIYNGSLPRIVPVPFVYAFGGSGEGLTYYTWYYPENDTWSGTNINLGGTFREVQYATVYGDKVLFVGRGGDNASWAVIVYTNGTVFSNWHSLG